VPALPRTLVRAWRALERFAESRRAAPALFGAALLVYGVVSLAFPLTQGRDLGRYLVVYAQLFGDHVVYPYALVSRPPGTPLVAGVLLEAGPIVAEVGAAVLYAVSIVAWCAVARRFGPAAAIATAAALLLYPGYVLLFHQLSSDLVFAAVFSLAALLLARAVERPSLGRAAALGAGVAALVLVRPVAQALLLLVLVPLIAAPTWRGRLLGSATFILAAVLPLLVWAGHNAVRGDDFTLARGGGATLPLFRVFVADKIVDPANGEASRELAAAVQRQLLPEEPYRSYGVDLEEFFSAGSARMHEDLTGLADRRWGWDDDYEHLARVGREAVLEHPGTYARGVLSDVRDLLVWPLYAETGSGAAPPDPKARRLAQADLPEPSEGEPIPAARQSSYITTPDGRISEVWTSATEHHIVFHEPRDVARADEVDRRVDGLLESFPDRSPRAEAVEWLNRASRWYPRPVVWLVLGLVAVVVRRRALGGRALAVPGILSAAALLILLATSLAVYAVAEYSVPVAPAFILLATVGWLGQRGSTFSATTRAGTPTT
jgi:Dolichyl-phosphate-mannose-protein mannosyltransferase